MTVLDIQRRGQQIGRIRIGQQVLTGEKDRNGNDKTRPVRLDTFRFTTASKVAADAIAALFGGEVRAWERGQFEIITRESAIGVTVPPRDQVVGQSYEMWNKGGCIRRCDSQHEQISRGPCLCPHAEDTTDAGEVANAARRRAEMAKLNPPQACKLITRINVMIPDLPGLGVFRLDTHSYYAAVEIGDAAALMQLARERGVFLPAMLRIEQRQRVAGGKTTPYPVPVLEVMTTFRDLATGAIEAAGMTAQLPPAPGEPPRAITAAPAAAPAARAAQPDVPAAPEPPPDEDGGEDLTEPWQRACAIYQRALAATTPGELKACFAQAEAEGLADEQACIDPDADEWQDLHSALQDVWRDKGRSA